MKNIVWELVPGFLVSIRYQYYPAEKQTHEQPGEPAYIEILDIRSDTGYGSKVSLLDVLSEQTLDKLTEELKEFEAMEFEP